MRARWIAAAILPLMLLTQAESCTDEASDDSPADVGQPADAQDDAPVVTEAPGPSMTPSQEQAYGSALAYLDYSSFSKLGLVGQLEYEQFSNADATFAVNLLDVDWNEQAAETARNYLDYSSFSCGSLTDQLVYEKFTAAQAAYGAQQSGIC